MIISHYKKLYELPWQTAICNIAQQSLYKKAFIRKNRFFEEKHIYLLDLYSEFIFLEYKKVFFPKISDCNLSGHFILLQKRIINEKFFPYQYFNIYLTHQKTYFYKKTYFELFYLSLIKYCSFYYIYTNVKFLYKNRKSFKTYLFYYNNGILFSFKKAYTYVKQYKKYNIVSDTNKYVFSFSKKIKNINVNRHYYNYLNFINKIYLLSFKKNRIIKKNILYIKSSQTKRIKKEKIFFFKSKKTFNYKKYLYQIKILTYYRIIRENIFINN